MCVVCANKVGQGMTACVKEREGKREGAYAVRIVMENCCHVGVGLQQKKNKNNSGELQLRVCTYVQQQKP